MSTPPAIAHSPKFHRDRSGYADAQPADVSVVR